MSPVPRLSTGAQGQAGDRLLPCSVPASPWDGQCAGLGAALLPLIASVSWTVLPLRMPPGMAPPCHLRISLAAPFFPIILQ